MLSLDCLKEDRPFYVLMMKVTMMKSENCGSLRNLNINSLCDVLHTPSNIHIHILKTQTRKNNYDNVLNELNILSSDFLH